MSYNNCSCRPACGVVALIVSIFIGIIAAILRFTAIITVTPAFLWVVLGVAVVYQAILLVTSAITCKYRCICFVLPYLQVAILGAILTSILLLAIEFAATSAIGAIITGISIAFFALIFGATACLIKCLANCDE